VCDSKSIASFHRKFKHSKKFGVEKHYLELQIAASFGWPDIANVFKTMPKNAFFEAGEFLTAASAVYQQLPTGLKQKFRRTFNGMFGNQQGLVPLAFEYLTAAWLTREGFEVEFVELSGRGQFDFEISKDGVVAQVDCKSIGDNLGRFFGPSTGDAVYEKIVRYATKYPKIFNGAIVHLQVLSRDRRQYDMGIEITKLLQKLHCAQQVTSDVMRIELLPFTNELCDEICSLLKRVPFPFWNGFDDTRVVSCIARNKPDLSNSQIEAVYVLHPMVLREFRLAVLLTSFRSGDWKDRAVSALKTSLDGQLRDQPAPVLALRFNGLSDFEKRQFFWDQSEPPMVSPPHAILGEINRSSRNYAQRLCAILFDHQPSYSRTSMLDPSGHPFYMRDPFTLVWCMENPVGRQLKNLISIDVRGAPPRYGASDESCAEWLR
jgi:hypothetical protein